MSLDRVREPSGMEIELWESLTYRSLGAWEKGENPGYCKGEMLYYYTRVLLIGAVLVDWCCWNSSTKVTVIRFAPVQSRISGRGHSFCI